MCCMAHGDCPPSAHEACCLRLNMRRSCSARPLPPGAARQVVHCCGYDSVPFDIGVLVVADHIRNKLGK